MSFTFETKNSATFTLESKTLVFNEFLLKEDGDNLLLESGDRIILDQSVAGAVSYSLETKNTS